MIDPARRMLDVARDQPPGDLDSCRDLPTENQSAFSCESANTRS